MFSYPGKNDSCNSITNSIIVIRKKFISNEKCDFTFLAQKTHTHTTHTFNGPLSRITWVSRYEKGKTNLDFTEARDSEWHQLGHMQVCTSLQTDNHASTTPLKFFIVRMPFLPPNQQRQSTDSAGTEGASTNTTINEPNNK